MIDLAVGVVLGVLASLAVIVAVDRTSPEPAPTRSPAPVVVVERPPPIIA